jgi:hypothetical protein
MRTVATKFCPECGDEFVDTTEACPDCEIALVDERPDIADGPKKGQTTYELHEWAVESRVMLESLLTGQGLPHAWEGTDLQVPAALESKVDVLIEQVEVTTEPNLDPDAPKVAYELADWDDEQQTVLIQSLDAKGIPYDFDVDGSLVVLESDDPVVEAVFDELTGAGSDDDEAEDGDEDGDDGDGDGGEPTARQLEADVDEVEAEVDALDAAEGRDVGDPASDVLETGIELDAQSVMSDLFVAADRLRKKAADHQGVLTMVDRAADAERMRLPFGFNRHDWEQIVEQATALRDLIEDDDSKDADIEARATVLRGTLRPFV